MLCVGGGGSGEWVDSVHRLKGGKAGFSFPVHSASFLFWSCPCIAQISKLCFSGLSGKGPTAWLVSSFPMHGLAWVRQIQNGSINDSCILLGSFPETKAAARTLHNGG